MAFLVDDRAGEAYQIGRAPLGIGRDPVSHVIVLDPAVSRFHAEVRSTTTVVIVAVFAFAGFFWVVDAVLGNAIKYVYTWLGAL